MAQTDQEKAKLPKHYLLEQAIVEKINTREYREDEPIPSERELVESFGVSRITVRRAARSSLPTSSPPTRSS